MKARFLVCLMLVSQTPLFAMAWGDLGHSIVGEVAEQNLTPRAKDFIRGVLGVEPLATAAVWPDHVRDDARFGHKETDPSKVADDVHDFANFHFCTVPVGTTYSTKPKKDAKDCYGVITKAIQLLKAPLTEVSREEKMIALRYLVHVMGDIHQPLHIGNGTDRGGNGCTVAWLTPNRTTNMHSLWDETIVQYLGTTYADATMTPPRRAAIYMGDFLTNLKRVRPEMFTAEAKAQAAKGTVEDWVNEGAVLREQGMYPKNQAAYCAAYADENTGVLQPGSPIPGKIPPENIPLLDEEHYAKPQSKFVETQLLKGGLRLAATLDDIAATAKAPQAAIDETLQEKIISFINRAFRN